jgi:hypothetical protein
VSELTSEVRRLLERPNYRGRVVELIHGDRARDIIDRISKKYTGSPTHCVPIGSSY